MKLSTDYEIIRKEAEEIRNNIIKCCTVDRSFAYLNAYELFCIAYATLTGKNIYKDDDIYNRFYNQGEIYSEGLLENFISNKNNHREMFMACLEEPIDTLDDFLESNEYKNLTKMHFKSISDKKAREILYDFFKNTDEELIDIYKNLEADNKLLLLSNDSSFSENPENVTSNGSTYKNPLQNSYFILMNSEENNVLTLSTIVHELGHVKDYMDNRRFPIDEQCVYPFKSIYTEVISTNYELKFLEYLIENNLLCEDVKLSLANFYNKYFESLNNSYIYSCVKDENDEILDRGFFTKQEVLNFTSLRNGFELEQKTIFDFDNETIIMMPYYVDLEYTYGLIVSSHIKDNKNIREKFLNLRSGYFDYEELNNIGITPETTSKQLVKNITKYLN